MTKSQSLKAIVLSLGLAALMAPATMNAQINRGLLENPYKDNSNKNHGMMNQQKEGGRAMKKLAIFAAAFVLTLGLAQCKKEQPNAQITEGETVHITVNVNNNGSRADVNTSTGHITFNDNDKLYVGYNNACVGTLDYSTSANKFSGDITISQSGSQRLHFYYLGGSLEPAIDGTEYTVDLSDQTSNYPVISYGTSNKDYDGAGTYRTTLLNKCALVKFNLANGTTDAVAVGGMMTKATIDFANPGVVTPSAAGEITLHTRASNTEKWAILLSQSAVDNAPVAIGKGYLGYMVGVPAIEDNDFAPEINTIDNSGTANVVILNRLTEDYMAQNGQVLTGTLANNVKISIADDATVTLGGVSINANGAWTSGNYAGITCEGKATIILKDGSENTVRGFNEDYPGIYVPEGSTLTIKGGAAGTGKLTASPYDGGGTEYSYGAGIGGRYEKPCGNIEIQGGDITANGGEAAAGIGSAYNASCGAITITGGTVTANGGDSGAGIGSGQDADCGTITISGGTVTANGGYNAAGIGSGNGGSCVAITIFGGTVTATGGKYAAGIGSGYNGASCGAITITTGVTSVTATKGKDATNSIGAGIGSSCGTVTIEPGANVTQN